MKAVHPFARIVCFLLLTPMLLIGNPALAKSTLTALPAPTSLSASTAVTGSYTANLPLIGSGLPSPACHFVIVAPFGFNGYNLSELGVGAALDWGSSRNPTLEKNIDYLPVLPVRDQFYSQTLSNLPSVLTQNRGATWIIGNEPDSEVAYQDHITAETYAERYYQLATLIRASDPTAKLGFGSVIQPTPIRLYYLDKTMQRLAQLAGGMEQALALIDVYTFHAFILNEEQIYNPQKPSWGAGLPLGYDASTWPAPEVILLDETHDETWKTHDIQIFKERVIHIREWMQKYGEINKPLWITEYGSLFPSVPGDLMRVSEADTIAYMQATFNFMLGYQDQNLGDALDAGRLVQRFAWYSLNEELGKFGGSLYDPSTHVLTGLGQAFIDYSPSTDLVPLTNPDVYIDKQSILIQLSSVVPGQVSYRLILKAGNQFSTDRRTPIQVDIYMDGSLVGSVQAFTPRCGGQADIPLDLSGLVPGSTHTFSAQVSVMADGGVDVAPGNNAVTFLPVQVPMIQSLYLPSLMK